MLRIALPATVLAASTLLFSFSASADDHRNRSWNSDRHHYDRDRDRRYNDDRRHYRRDRHRDYRRGDWRSDHRYRRPSQRYYWHDGHYWRYGYVPNYYRGRYYSYPPRDSRGRLIITVPLW